MGILLRGGKTGRWGFGLARRCVREGCVNEGYARLDLDIAAVYTVV